MFKSLEEIYDKYSYDKITLKEYEYLSDYIIKLYNDQDLNLYNVNNNEEYNKKKVESYILL